MEDLISIIISIYNTEKYLKRCLDSILNQTYKNIEIILINDGSTDKCDEICKQYSEIDQRIKYLKNKNQGVSKSRNIGIEIANGRYITFVDSDDYIEKNHIELLVKDATLYNSDVVIGNYCMKNEKDENILEGNNYRYKSINLSNDESRLMLLNKINSGKIQCYVWRLLIEKEKIEKFDTNIKFWEDKLFYIKLLFKTNNIYFEEEITYNYCRNNDSCTMRKDNIINKIYDIVKVNNEILKVLKDNNIALTNIESQISLKNLEVILYFIMQMYEYNVVDKEKLKILLKSKEIRSILFKIDKATLNNNQKVKYFLIKNSNISLIHLYYIIVSEYKNKGNDKKK